MSIQKIPDVDDHGLRQFGLILGGVLAAVPGLLLPWQWGWHDLPNWYWIGGGVLISAWALLNARSMRGFYQVWMRVAIAIGVVVNAVFLAVVFFMLITPMGLISRMMGNDPMRRTLDANAVSYRVKSKVASRHHMERPY